MQDELVSKTKRKREMHELQALGVALVELSESQLGFLQEELRRAVLEAKRISAHEGRRRQMQYIGRLMRDAVSNMGLTESTRAALKLLE